ncbi:FmdB family transcriptional regulator, partial [Pseudomonas sp. FW305-BF8]
MPTYQYQCNDCGRDLEVVQRFSDPSLTICPSCEG